jgi:LPS export ABC transporter protein LptC
MFKKQTNIKTKQIINKIKTLAKPQQCNITPSQAPQIKIQNFSMQEIDQNKSDIWTLNSREGHIFKTSNQIECFDVVCKLIRNNQLIAQLKSCQSLLDRNKKNIFMFGEVKGNFKNLNIFGFDFSYNFSTQLIKTDKMATITYPRLKVMSNQSFVDLRNNKIEMSGGIKTEICK